MQYKILLLLLATAYCFNYLPQVEIDLSAPPRQRWKESVRTVLSLYGYDNSFGPVFQFHNENTFSILTTEDYTTIANAIRKNFPEYSLELEGIVEEFNRPEVTFEYMAAWAYFHEIGHITSDITECTGVLLSIGDQIIHGRNMDQYPGQARNIVLHLTIKKDGKYLGESVDWYWFKVGFVTLLKYNVASLEENWRFGDPLSKDQLLTFIQQGVPSLAWAYRDVLVNEKLNTFQKVVSYLEQNPVACALYNIIGGTGKDQGVIISRDPFETYPTISLSSLPQGQNGYKYLVQTNYDHWLPDPEDDQRRTIAENLLAKMQNNLLNEFGVYAVMDTYPIHNEGTFYTVIMNAKYNRLIAFGQPSITLSDE
ncbi:unnamed protein product [Paramecium pentaurelia]|uniref:ceramidase n=1 Tax=Paramecium pentaurelia TaxID=43138 RepID=A0A8S1TDN6_9CILI|nr:unnamed protein product [Paramecium pentaurelia]